MRGVAVVLACAVGAGCQCVTLQPGDCFVDDDGCSAPARRDAGEDAGNDRGADAGAPDAGLTDAGVVDASVVDAGAADAGVADAGVADAGVPDAGPVDAGASFLQLSLVPGSWSGPGAGSCVVVRVQLFDARSPLGRAWGAEPLVFTWHAGASTRAATLCSTGSGEKGVVSEVFGDLTLSVELPSYRPAAQTVRVTTSCFASRGPGDSTGLCPSIRVTTTLQALVDVPLTVMESGLALQAGCGLPLVLTSGQSFVELFLTTVPFNATVESPLFVSGGCMLFDP